ncbi:hypothetical protein FOA52_003693 [Chlamydomonas sp. UWO 241]|nr:hypothetical protein FOA52_003693 [Chlamydomonas sp. UWO 241]
MRLRSEDVASSSTEGAVIGMWQLRLLPLLQLLLLQLAAGGRGTDARGFPSHGLRSNQLIPGRESTHEQLSRATRAPTHSTLSAGHAAANHAARLAWANTWGEYRDKHAAALHRVAETGSLGRCHSPMDRFA